MAVPKEKSRQKTTPVSHLYQPDGTIGEIKDAKARNGIDNIWATMWNTIYPVGAIYISAASTSPAELFGGSWERITGRFLLAATDSGGTGGNSTASVKAGYTGGEATHTLTTSEMPSHNHEEPLWMWAVSRSLNSGKYNIPGGTSTGNADTYNDGKSKQAQYVTNTGGDQAHNNMPPYLAVYVWKRVAA